MKKLIALATIAMAGIALAWNVCIGADQPRDDRRPPAPPGVQGALDEMKLSGEQRQKIDPIVQEYRRKQQEARDEFLKQMKEALTSQQYETLEKSMRRPAPPPPRNRQPAEDRARANQPSGQDNAAIDKDPSHVAVRFIGGYDTDPRDHGRPVILVASALGVSSEVFRKAFSGVTPAGPGSGGPTPDEARRNKAALMQVLGPYGITNDRLDEVSNFYRYSASKGQMWRNAPAAAFATVRDGAVTSITITNPGAGYSSAPKISVAGVGDVNAEVKLSYGTDCSTNGSIKEIVVRH